MRRLIQTLLPYCRRHKATYLAGFAAVLLANFLYVRAIVPVGRTADYILSDAMTIRGSNRP